MKKYEYLTKEYRNEKTIQDSELNELGQEGWKLVFVDHFEYENDSISRFYFKREIFE